MKARAALMVVMAAAGLLAACATTPPLQADRNDLPFAQVITIRSQSDQDVLVRRAVANDRPNDPLCARAVEDVLAPGESLQVTFVGCGKVRTLVVQSDRGPQRFDFTQ